MAATMLSLFHFQRVEIMGFQDTSVAEIWAKLPKAVTVAVLTAVSGGKEFTNLPVAIR